MMEEKRKAIETVRLALKKEYGEDCLFYLGSNQRSYVKRLSSGSISLDIALGGGYPIGRVIEIFGHESSGKTTLALTAVAQAQEKGGIAAYIDVEQALDVKYASNLGVDVENLVISQPDCGEDALQIAEVLLRSGAIDILVVDSVSALVTHAELEGDMGDSHVGRQARLMGQALRKLTPLAQKVGCTLIFINQLREKVGIMFGNNEVTSGGRALKFFSSVRLDVRRVGTIKEGDKFIGNRVRVKTAKNKVAPPLRQVEFDVMYGEGISRVGDLLDLAVELNIVLKSGSWYSYNDMKLGQGRDRVKLYLESNEELLDEIEDKIRVISEIKENDSNIEVLSSEVVDNKTAKAEYEHTSVINKSDNTNELDITRNDSMEQISEKLNESIGTSIEDLEEDINLGELDIFKEDEGVIESVNDKVVEMYESVQSNHIEVKEEDVVIEAEVDIVQKNVRVEELNTYGNDIECIEDLNMSDNVNNELEINEVLDRAENIISNVEDESLPDALSDKENNRGEVDKEEALKVDEKEELNQPQKPNQINLFDFFGFDKKH